MTMDPRLRRFSGAVSGVHLGNQPFSVLPNPNVMTVPRFDTSANNNNNNNNNNYNGFLDPSQSRFHSPPTNLTPIDNGNSISGVSHEQYSLEDCDFSDTVLKYISQILMEEDIEDKTPVLQESLDLQAAEKSFYEVLGKKYPPSPEQSHGYIFQNGDNLDANFATNCSSYTSISYYSSEYLGDNNLSQNLSECTSQLQHLPAYGVSQSSYSCSNGGLSSVDGFLDSPNTIIRVPDLSSESQSVWQFKKGVEEASRFLPTRTELFVNLENNGLSSPDLKAGTPTEVSAKVDRKDDDEFSTRGSRGRKNPYREEEDVEEERSSKLAAVYIESTLRSKMFDLVLLSGNLNGGQCHLSSFRETLRNRLSNSMQPNGQSKGSNGGGKGRGKKLGGKKEVVDLRTLLIQCAQAVAADDHKSANELLKQVRQHSSPFGDGNQRLASCFADGLEARLAGTGSQIYKGLVSKKTCAADMLKAYRLYLAACPFRKISNFSSNKTIMQISSKATRVHVLDFGILYGFQWPTFIQRLSMRDGGPPKLRITGIEFPQPGFRPAERVEETGRRLKDYAESFSVPFEYSAIAKRWETITVEELKIDEDEFVVVNCLYRGKNLLDESVTVQSAKDVVLDLIRKINPDIFIHGIVNGAYNAPFYVTRFREAMFHFSAIFDMLETIVPRGEPERMLIEKEIFGREALNVIACEGWERVERPETYKQWQVRIMRSGFVQIPLGRDIVKRATEKVRSTYHRDFIIDEDSGWLVQGWKGRIIFALSSWKPT